MPPMPPGIEKATAYSPRSSVQIPSTGNLTFSVTPPATFVLYVTPSLNPAAWQAVGTNGIPVTFPLSAFDGITNAPDYAQALSWDPSPDPLVAGYMVYVGTNSGTYTASYKAGYASAGISISTNSSLATNITITGLTAVLHYYAATTFNSNGKESAFSAEVSGNPVAVTQPRTLFFKSNTNKLQMQYTGT